MHSLLSALHDPLIIMQKNMQKNMRTNIHKTNPVPHWASTTTTKQEINGAIKRLSDETGSLFFVQKMQTVILSKKHGKWRILFVTYENQKILRIRNMLVKSKKSL